MNAHIEWLYKSMGKELAKDIHLDLCKMAAKNNCAVSVILTAVLGKEWCK